MPLELHLLHPNETVSKLNVSGIEIDANVVDEIKRLKEEIELLKNNWQLYIKDESVVPNELNEPEENISLFFITNDEPSTIYTGVYREGSFYHRCQTNEYDLNMFTSVKWWRYQVNKDFPQNKRS